MTYTVASHCTVLRSENWALGRSSDSHNIIMESIPNNLVGQVNFCSTTEVNFQRFSCTRGIPYSCDCYETTIQENGLALGLSSLNDLAHVSWCILQSPGNLSIVG